ncbi:MAG: 2OG-Fe(II) oxygenase [Planctomycetaceae bacterium]|nr:2OG-Fe(II) oxygenase [Planctomycetaceae bacterium]
MPTAEKTCLSHAVPSTKEETFFRSLDVDVREIDQHTDAIGRLRLGDLTGIIVRNVYSPEFLQLIVQRLEQHDPPFVKTLFPEKFRSWFYGRNLNLLDVSLSQYFTEASVFHQQLEELFPEPEHGLQGRVMRVLSQLDQNRPYRAAPGIDIDDRYLITTIRGHGEGGYIAAHCDNEQTMRPGYQHLQTIVQNHIYSVIVVLAAADEGGQLEVYDWRTEPENARLLNDDSVHHRPDLSQLSSVRLEARAGDLMIVDSGRYLHRVTPVIGPRVRWTLCSFMAPARGRRAVYCWG